MADITARRTDVDAQQGQVISIPLAAIKVFEGGLISITTTTGYAGKAGDDANTVFAGVADETVDNSAGSAGDKSVPVRVGEVVKLAAGFTATQAHVGTEVYLSDDQTVDLVGTTTNDVYAGRIVEFVSSSVVRVALAPFGGKR